MPRLMAALFAVGLFGLCLIIAVLIDDLLNDGRLV